MIDPRSSDLMWRIGFEADPGRQLRRAAGLMTGRRGARALRGAVRGRKVLITGASAGIGRETARLLAPGDPELLLVARRRDRLEALAAELGEAGATAHVLPCDLADLDAVDALAAAILDEHGAVDVLVNSAGHSIRRALFERVMRLNYFSALHLTLPLVARMREQGRGHVVNVSTLGTQFGPEPRFAAYLASKGAMDSFARSAAAETGLDGVHWTTVHMPLVRTEMIAPTEAYSELPALSAERAAEMVIDGIVRRPARVSHPYGVALHLVDLATPRVLERAMGQAMGRGGSPRAKAPAGESASQSARGRRGPA